MELHAHDNVMELQAHGHINHVKHILMGSRDHRILI